jgi:hypothetical protein
MQSRRAVFKWKTTANVRVWYDINLLIRWSEVIIGKLIVTHLVKNILCLLPEPKFYFSKKMSRYRIQNQNNYIILMIF